MKNTSRKIDLDKDTSNQKSSSLRVSIACDGSKFVSLYATTIAENDAENGKGWVFSFGGHHTKTTMTAINTVLREVSAGLIQLKSVGSEVVVLKDVGGYQAYMETGKATYKKVGIFTDGMNLETMRTMGDN